MKKTLLLTFLLISFLCEAQQKIAVVEWDKTIGGYGNDYLNSIIQTRDSGFIGGGYSDGGGYGIVKLNKTGGRIWGKSYRGNNIDILKIVQPTNNGGYILGGYSTSSNFYEKSEMNLGGADFWILKVDSIGTIIWQNTIGGNDHDKLTSLNKTTDGGYILGGYSISNISFDKTENSNGYDYWVVKINSSGSIVWQNTITADNNDYLTSIIQTSDGGYLVGGYTNSQLSGDKTDYNHNYYDYDFWVLKLNSSGNIIWQKTLGGTNDEKLSTVIQTRDHGYLLGGFSNSNKSGNKTEDSKGGWDYWMIKLDNNGDVLWDKTVGGDRGDSLYSLIQLSSGGYLLSGISNSNSNTGDKMVGNRGGTDYWVLKLDESLNIVWQRTLGGQQNDVAKSIIETFDKKYVVGGESTSGRGYEKTEFNTGINESDYWILKLSEKDANSISGKIFQSKNSNCMQDINEKGVRNIIVNTEPQNFYGVSDSSGKYTILTDTGKYTLNQIIPYYTLPLFRNVVCPSNGLYQNISFTQYGQDTTEINFANDVTLCAYLQLELAQGRMRRCFDNNATIKYCNIGNVDTNNVQVIVQLPEYVTFVSASNPNYTVSGKKITFRIGALRANECGTINLVTHVDCINGITGLTQCIKAYILPRNECVKKIQTDYSLWDGSEITADGSCTGSTVRFVIKNIGQNMADSSTYRIYKNAVEALSKNFKLTAGDSLIINVTATGHTFRIEANQTVHYPTESAPNITVENCNNTNIANRGFVNQQEQDKAEQDVEKICLEIRDSYDPNDKQIFPAGVGVDKRVRHQVPLDFLIRFQNTGTDTAYKVVITDTLNQNLDLATLEFGASSHPYKIEFTGSGKPILKLTFDKINLVDSFTNEPKSHGFISFKITPYDSIPNGTLVKNSADIYFDFNLPIKTNTTQVSIDDRLPTGATLNLVTSVKQNNTIYEAIQVYPNPFTQTTNFEFVYNTKANQLFIYDVNGELVIQENIAGKTTFQLQRANLPNGMYFYNIQNKDGDIIGRGKLVLQ